MHDTVYKKNHKKPRHLPVNKQTVIDREKDQTGLAPNYLKPKQVLTKPENHGFKGGNTLLFPADSNPFKSSNTWFWGTQGPNS